LQDGTTTVAAATLPALGIPTARAGHVLRLPSGELGVVEACSGVRSVTAILAVAVLLAYLRRLGLVRGACFVLLALPVVGLANAARVTLDGALQEWIGPWVNEGAVHELIGVGVLLAALWGVLLL